ncbi:hypothetical protein [Paenibacillus contaminans]|uniref:hypothetical protein n=1 Tax=Paenibacillus contaminans TaxID=450362 RepID=UPI00131401F2|nr:hypothetical protein [Paenibacillus contaminans]
MEEKGKYGKYRFIMTALEQQRRTKRRKAACWIGKGSWINKGKENSTGEGDTGTG